MYTKESFQKKIDEKYPQEKLEVTLFNGVGRPGVIKCLQCGEIYSLQNARNFIINGKKIVCKNCQGTKAVVKEVKHKIDNILEKCSLEVIIPFRRIGEDMEFRCHKCHQSFKRKPRIFLQTQKCPYCESRSKLKPKDVFLQDLLEKYDNEYVLLGEYKNAQTPTLFEHTPCGFKWNVRPNDILCKAPCPRCHSSKGEKQIEKYLKQGGINYEPQKRFDDLPGLSYDFYLVDMNILIEFQGEQHYMPIPHFGGEEKFQYQLKNDQKKREYAKDHQYTLLEIKYTDIKNIDIILSDFIAQRLNIQSELNDRHLEKDEDIV